MQLDINSFLSIYAQNHLIKYASEEIFHLNQHNIVRMSGLVRSLDAVIVATIYQNSIASHVIVLSNKEESACFYHDIRNLLPQKEIVLFFPTSYKKPYQFSHTENSNIVQRIEALSKIHRRGKKFLIVTYPEALTEKVISKIDLVRYLLNLKKGVNIAMESVEETLSEYAFERTDFVHESGQFAIRGGIMDIFSYADEYPFRIEFLDNQIESIRAFDAITQLSISERDQAIIIPNIQTKFQHATREYFFDFLPKGTRIWFKDIELTADVIETYFQKANQYFTHILETSSYTRVVHEPENLFESKESFLKKIHAYKGIIEFGRKFYFSSRNVTHIEFSSQPQVSFQKNFQLLANTLERNQNRGIQNIISSSSPRQLMRLINILGEINSTVSFKGLHITLSEGFIDRDAGIACYTDHQIFDRFFMHKAKSIHTKSKAITLKELLSLQIGDYVVHTDHGIGRFGGLEKFTVGKNNQKQEVIRLIYRDNDLLYISIHALYKISKYSGREGVPAINKLSSSEWIQKKKTTKRKIKDIAKDLIELYARRKASKGFSALPDSYLQEELESSFIYVETPDQSEAIEKVKEDMEKTYPMDRLVCGDVGFGKTEIAIRAAFKAFYSEKQVAVLVPTTLLAYQHYGTFTERLKGFSCEVAHINRFRKPKEVRQIIQNLRKGKIHILIGTHRILSKDISFKDLGLLIVDEEQKFGVKTKEKLKQIKVNVDTLTLTATPIPRTLHFSLMGARDLSIISTPPPNRQSVATELHTYNKEIIRDSIRCELERRGQVFFVHNRIQDIIHMTDMILHLVPDAKVAYAHGQMEGEKLEKIMMKFVAGEYDVLVSTNIIESGLDIPNVNTIIINLAHTFGLSDLYQMRGRVGRSNKKAYCYLLTPPVANLPLNARKRLSSVEEFSNLGDGFNISMRDLDIRGAGNILGAEQSGFINDLGFEMYNKVLEEAIQELKEEEFKDIFIKDKSLPDLSTFHCDCQIETDLEILLPEDYVINISERLNLYVRINKIKTREILLSFENELKDRFGPLPDSAKHLLKSVELRWKAKRLGIEKLILKNNKMKAYLPYKEKIVYYQSDSFGKIVHFIHSYPKLCHLKEAGKRLIFTVESISSIDEAEKYLNKIK